MANPKPNIADLPKTYPLPVTKRVPVMTYSRSANTALGVLLGTQGKHQRGARGRPLSLVHIKELFPPVNRGRSVGKKRRYRYVSPDSARTLVAQKVYNVIRACRASGKRGKTGKQIRDMLLSSSCGLASLVQTARPDLSPVTIHTTVYSVVGQLCGRHGERVNRIVLDKTDINVHDNYLGNGMFS